MSTTPLRIDIITLRAVPEKRAVKNVPMEGDDPYIYYSLACLPRAACNTQATRDVFLLLRCGLRTKCCREREREVFLAIEVSGYGAMVCVMIPFWYAVTRIHRCHHFLRAQQEVAWSMVFSARFTLRVRGQSAGFI